MEKWGGLPRDERSAKSRPIRGSASSPPTPQVVDPPIARIMAEGITREQRQQVVTTNQKKRLAVVATSIAPILPGERYPIQWGGFQTSSSKGRSNRGVQMPSCFLPFSR